MAELPAVPLPNVSFPWGHYIALSYIWGDRTAGDFIYVDGRPTNATKNLVDALKALRSKGARLSDSLIWADSLCVDQGDIDDRNRHVSLMRNIYANAGYVVAWLGEEHSHSGIAFDMVYSLAAAWELKETNLVSKSSLQAHDVANAGTWIALLKLMDREYWSRVWIIQELCLGSSSMPILCGHRALPWCLLYTVLWKILYHHQDHVISIINEENVQRHQPILQEGHKDLFRRSFLYHINIEQCLNSGRIEELSARNRAKMKDGWHIMPILDLARRSNATLDHDRVYGLMGLLPKPIRQTLEPTYDSPVGDAFVSFAKAWICSQRDLEILGQCVWTGQSSLPSWTPDWRHREHLRLFSGANSPYSPCNEMKMVASFPKDDSSLTVRGVFLDTLDGLGAVTIGNHWGAPDFVQSESLANQYPSDVETKDALWRTLVGNITTAGHKAQDSYRSLLDIPLDELQNAPSSSSLGSVRLKQFQEFILASARLRIGGRPLVDYFGTPSHIPPSQTLSPEQSSLGKALEQAFRFSRLKRIATTTKGYIAMVPSAATSGDVVCVVPGSTVPMVIRPASSGICAVSFHVVGACYIHGYMYGEALDEVDCGILRFENIDLI